MALLCIIAIVGMFIWAGRAFIDALSGINSYSEIHYNYTPVTWKNAGWMALAWVTIALGLIMGFDNFLGGLAFVGFIVFRLATRISINSSSRIAALSLAILSVAGLLLLVGGVVVLLIVVGAHNKEMIDDDY